MKKGIDLEALAAMGERPANEIEQDVLRTLRSLDAVAKATRLYSVSGLHTARMIQKRAMRSIQNLTFDEFIIVEDEGEQ